MTEPIRNARQMILALCLVGITSALFAQTALEPGSPNAPDPRMIVGEPVGLPISGDPLEVKTREVSALLRCPVCQGLSVWDSPAPMAVNMKNQVRDLLGQGYDRDQVLAYYEGSYGEFVLLSPARRGLNWLVWLAPIALLLIGVGVVWRLFRTHSQPLTPGAPTAAETTEEDLPGRDSLPDDESLVPWVLRARELAYGWPGGVRAGSEDEGTP